MNTKKSLQGYEFTHYADVKQGAVIHFLIEDGFVLKCYSINEYFNNKVKGKGINIAKEFLKNKYGRNFKTLKEI